MKQLSKDVDIRWLKGAVAAGASIDDDSAIVDTAGYDGVCFVTPIVDSAATGVATATAEQNTANSTSGMAALAGAAAVATCTTNDDLNGKLLVVDVYRPQERYLRLNRVSAVANIAYGDVIAILYHGRRSPAQMSGVAAAAAASSPGEA